MNLCQVDLPKQERECTDYLDKWEILEKKNSGRKKKDTLF